MRPNAATCFQHIDQFVEARDPGRECAFGLKGRVERNRAFACNAQRAPVKLNLLDFNRAARVAPLRQPLGGDECRVEVAAQPDLGR